MVWFGRHDEMAFNKVFNRTSNLRSVTRMGFAHYIRFTPLPVCCRLTRRYIWAEFIDLRFLYRCSMQAKSLEESETSENAWLQSAVCEFNNLCFAKRKIGSPCTSENVYHRNNTRYCLKVVNECVKRIIRWSLMLFTWLLTMSLVSFANRCENKSLNINQLTRVGLWVKSPSRNITKC